MDMNRSTVLMLIAFALAVFGIYRAVYVPGMLVGLPVPLLLVGFLLQAVFGIIAAVGVWRGATWAPLVILLLGASVAATALFEILLGIIAYLRALLDAVVAIIVTVLMAAYVRRAGSSRATSDPG
jgi:hypothetical protein